MHYVCLRLGYIAGYCVWLSNYWKRGFADLLGRAPALARRQLYFGVKVLSDANIECSSSP